MLRFVADSEYGIPRRCMCGGRFINEPWVIGVQEELERLTKRVEEAEQVMMGVSNLTKQIETLEEQVKILNEQVYDLTVQVDTLEKVCFD
ncbi:hypothetical protein Bca52824_066796 [Brassica carinata]|uniref:Uncharacterized protein n=1 Tax=Brassica carinata TaxID=52824 RepID=A0A8X7UDR1_BRACI|nr:hypothetical protein Bca52824_066796 [Brassica carinata]